MSLDDLETAIPSPPDSSGQAAHRRQRGIRVARSALAARTRCRIRHYARSAAHSVVAGDSLCESRAAAQFVVRALRRSNNDACNGIGAARRLRGDGVRRVGTVTVGHRVRGCRRAIRLVARRVVSVQRRGERGQDRTTPDRQRRPRNPGIPRGKRRNRQAGATRR